MSFHEQEHRRSIQIARDALRARQLTNNVTRTVTEQYEHNGLSFDDAIKAAIDKSLDELSVHEQEHTQGIQNARDALYARQITNEQ